MTARYVGYAAAAEYLGLPIGTLRSLVSRRQIPHARITPRLVRFDLNEIAEWISARKVAPIAGGQP